MAKPQFDNLNDPDNLRQLVQRLKEGIYVTNQLGEILDANPAFVEMMGETSLDALRGRKVMEFLVDPEERVRELELLEREGSVREFELRLKRPEGMFSTVIDTAYAARDPRSGEVLYHGILVDITERKQLERRLLEQTIRDPLTGCFNRRYLEEFEQRASDPGSPWGCIMIDIDRFKSFNDLFGHQAGDKVLVWMSRFLMRQTRAEEAVVRMGGDEFLVLLGGADVAHTVTAARRLEIAAETEAPVSFTMGWASREGGERLKRTIDRADQNLLKVRVEKRGPEQERRDRG
ncbi:MAG: sensor domain-containing diguanylate cyclase [Terriglobales bacterium]